jgi:hypothetical protein
MIAFSGGTMNRSAKLILSALLLQAFSFAAVAQDHVVGERVPRTGLIQCAGPAPHIVDASGPNVYVRLLWEKVPGAMGYSIVRIEHTSPILEHVSITPPLFAGVPVAGTSYLAYWDVVPDIGRIYSYKISALQKTTHCIGTATTNDLGPIWPNSPLFAFGDRKSRTTAILRWMGASGALTFRVIGPGLPSSGISLKAGTYSPETGPTVSVDTLTYNPVTGFFSYPLSNVPPGQSNYYISTTFPNNITNLNAATATVPAAPQCNISIFHPGDGSAGTFVIITGDHFDSVGRVSFTSVTSGRFWDSTPDVVSSNTIAVKTPDIDRFDIPGDFRITVHSDAWGDCTSEHQTYAINNPPPPKFTSVPNVFGDTLSVAGQALRNAQVALGTVTGPTAGTATVFFQSIIAGGSVPVGTKVDVKTTAMPNTPTGGFKQVLVVNQRASQHEIYVWSFDSMTGNWTPENSGKLVPFNGSAMVALQTGHFYEIAAVDTSNPLCDVGDDPRYNECTPWVGFFTGNASGPNTSATVQ